MIGVRVSICKLNSLYNRLNQIDDAGYVYDPNGNLIDDGTNTYEWDRANRMVSAPGNTAYEYDGKRGSHPADGQQCGDRLPA